MSFFRIPEILSEAEFPSTLALYLARCKAQLTYFYNLPAIRSRLFAAVLDLVEASDGADFVLIAARRSARTDCADDLASSHYWYRALHYEHVRSNPGEQSFVVLHGHRRFGAGHLKSECY